MKDAKLYYTPPSQESFDDMKKACLDVWGQYRDSPGGYYKEKTARIPDMQNISDNFMYLFAMFDINNQRQVVALLEPLTIEEVRTRMIDGGNGEVFTNDLLGTW